MIYQIKTNNALYLHIFVLLLSHHDISKKSPAKEKRAIVFMKIILKYTYFKIFAFLQKNKNKNKNRNES